MSSLVKIAARASKLSQAQVWEVLRELKGFHPQINFDPIWVETTGDKDQQTSLRTQDKTDFFTREIDALLLSGQCRIAIHSAKDLPDPLPKGLVLVALTKGVDPSDALVLRDGDTLKNLPPQARIGTSSLRREEMIKRLRTDLQCIDIRGAIEKRLSLLDSRAVDGVIVAEAALIRLGLTRRNRLRLPGITAPLQGRLAIVARKGDSEMQEFFAPLHSSHLS